MTASVIGFEPDEIRTDASTRSARLKWVIVVSDDLPTGRVVNAAVCVAAATAAAVPGLLGPDGRDGSHVAHPGLPWAGCSVLVGSPDTLQRIRTRAQEHPEVHLADMPLLAQETRVYDEYLSRLAESASEEVTYAALSLVGPRKRVDRLIGGLTLLP